MTSTKHTPGPWEIRVLMGLGSGRITGYTVERIHNPYTDKARAESLDRGRIYRTEALARAAIAKATGGMHELALPSSRIPAPPPRGTNPRQP